MRITKATHPHVWKYNRSLKDEESIELVYSEFKKQRHKVEMLFSHLSEPEKDAIACHLIMTHAGFHGEATPEKAAQRLASIPVPPLPQPFTLRHSKKLLIGLAAVILLLILALAMKAEPAETNVAHEAALHALVLHPGFFAQDIVNPSRFSFDSSNRLIITCPDGTCSGGGGGGGTSSTFGAAFPSLGTAIGVSDGTNMVAIVLGQKLAASSVPVVLTAAQLSTLTPLSTLAVTQSTSPWVISFTAPQHTITDSGSVTNATLQASAGVDIGKLDANQSINTAQVNGVTTLTGAGAVGTGAQRVAVGQDTTTIAGAAPGTAGTPSANVVTIQGVTSMTKLLVTPDSVALPANQSVNVSQLSGTTTDTNSGNKSAGTLRVVLATDQPALTTPLPVSCTAANCIEKLGDGTNTLVIDPCQGQTKVFTLISVTAGATLITGTSAKKQYLCAIQLISATAQNIAIVEGTGTVCATNILGLMGGATAATGWNLAANGGLTFGNGASSFGATTVNANNVCILTSSSGQISGSITSVAQ